MRWDSIGPTLLKKHPKYAFNNLKQAPLIQEYPSYYDNNPEADAASQFQYQTEIANAAHTSAMQTSIQKIQAQLQSLQSQQENSLQQKLCLPVQQVPIAYQPPYQATNQAPNQAPNPPQFQQYQSTSNQQ